MKTFVLLPHYSDLWVSQQPTSIIGYVNNDVTMLHEFKTHCFCFLA